MLTLAKRGFMVTKTHWVTLFSALIFMLLIIEFNKYSLGRKIMY